MGEGGGGGEGRKRGVMVHVSKGCHNYPKGPH